MWLIIAIVFVVLMLGLTKNQWNPTPNDIDMGRLAGNLAKFVPLGILIAVAITSFKDCVVVVPAGHRGVIFDRLQGGIQSKQLNEGMNIILPFVQEATLIDVRVQKEEFEATAASKDLQNVRTKVALNFSPIPEMVPIIFQSYGLGYTEKVVHPAVQEALKAATARYTAEELITRREEVKGQIHEILTRHVGQAHLKLAETFITDFEFSPEFARAIEAKQIAEQQALKAKRDLDRIKIEAEQNVAQAKAEAEGLRMQREAITPQLIELRKIEAQKLAIEKWDGKMPNIVPSNAMPLLDLGALKATR